MEYTLEKKISDNVFIGKRVGHGGEVAIKKNSTQHELDFYKSLHGLPGFALTVGSHSSEAGNYLVLQHLGPDLANPFPDSTPNVPLKTFTLNTVLKLVVQLITRI
ncbi:MAG: hypothetical protein M1813_009700 [Trichoglossum hirsutum]|nr:MAG: hypothetical protein M1813_009700 [Trichoglossum hirsutum]